MYQCQLYWHQWLPSTRYSLVTTVSLDTKCLAINYSQCISSTVFSSLSFFLSFLLLFSLLSSWISVWLLLSCSFSLSLCILFNPASCLCVSMWESERERKGWREREREKVAKSQWMPSAQLIDPSAPADCTSRTIRSVPVSSSICLCSFPQTVFAFLFSLLVLCSLFCASFHFLTCNPSVLGACLGQRVKYTRREKKENTQTPASPHLSFNH